MASAGRAARMRGRLVLAALLLAACGPAGGPQPIVYDREPCAHCRMLISEPRFAAQLETLEGEIQSFDDPGCLLAALETRPEGFRAIWFHHVREDRWLDAEHVAFDEAGRTPMGYGLGAVAAGTQGALSLEQARARVAQRGASREPAR